MFIRKTVAANACVDAVEKAVEAVGGAAVFRSVGLERMLRDVHGSRFHVLQEKRQHLFIGRVALGLDPIGSPGGPAQGRSWTDVAVMTHPRIC